MVTDSLSKTEINIVVSTSRIAVNERRFTTILAALFCLNVAIQLLDRPESFSEPIVFAQWPIFVCTIVNCAIWLGVGRWHFILKLALCALLTMLMLYVSATHWINNVMPEVPAAPFPWPVLALESGFVLTSIVSLFISTSVPLAIWRKFNTNEKPVLSISQLLAATTFVALTIAITITWFPYSGWLLTYVAHMVEIFNHPLVVRSYATDVIRDISVAYTSLACLFYFRSRYVYILSIAFSVAWLTTVAYFAISQINSSEFDPSATLYCYVAGQVFVSIMTTYLLLDFAFDSTDQHNLETI